MGASSEHDKKTALMNSWQLWLLAEGSHRLKPVYILAWMGKGVRADPVPTQGAMAIAEGFWRKES